MSVNRVQPRPPTRPEIEAGRSERGGWTKATLAAWGVPWPPPKGWRKKLAAGEYQVNIRDRETD